jgi:hypothetical protein
MKSCGSSLLKVLQSRDKRVKKNTFIEVIKAH